MSSNNEPTWKIYRKAVWMVVQNLNNIADAEDLLNRQDDHDMHIASGKCFILLLTAVHTMDKSHLEGALVEFRRLEASCGARSAGGWMRAVRQKLFPSVVPGVDDYDRQIALADATVCTAALIMAAHKDGPSVATAARAVYALRRAWKTYQQCYVAVLDVYRNVYDLDSDQNAPRWPPVLRRRQSVTLTQTSDIGSRMLRSATTSFETLRQNSVPNSMSKDVVRLMAAVSVGYGAFNLMVSLLPTKIMSVIGMLGFRVNRQTGLDALAFAKNGPDVHAPLAWGILSWYRMMASTDFMFDGPLSRENESYVNETEQLVCNPPEEFQNSTSLLYFTGRSCYLKGDLEGSIRAYEIGSTIIEFFFVNMKDLSTHELGFMYAIRLDWIAACKTFAKVAEDNVWMRPYHYFLATVCAGAAGDADAAESMMSRTAERRWPKAAERDMVGGFVTDRWRAVVRAVRKLRTGDGDHRRHCRLIVYEVLYVNYGVSGWPGDALHAVLADSREAEDDDVTTRYTKRFLTIICRRSLGYVDDYRRSLIEIVGHMERDKRRDHLYAYGLYELAAEQIVLPETVEEGKRTIQKLNCLKGPYHFQKFYEMRGASLLAYVQKSNLS